MPRFLLIFATLSFAAESALGEDLFWRIPEDKARCIQDNVDNYLANGMEPSVIVVMACPTVDLTDAISKSVENSGILKVGEGHLVMVLTSSELKCFKNIKLRADELGFITVPREINCD